MKFLIFHVLILVAVLLQKTCFCTDSNSIPSQNHMRMSAESCDFQGFRCTANNELQECIMSQLISIANCSGGKPYCNAELHMCIPDAPKNHSTFECQMNGIFPDPYNCSLYHLCSNKTEDTTVECDSGEEYDITSLNCVSTDVRTDVTCAKPPNCTHDGQKGSLDGNPSFWYTCVTQDESLYPQYFRCEKGRFINDLEECFDAMEFNCASQGVFPDPYNCGQYHICYNETEDIIMKCDPGQMYDVISMNCITGDEGTGIKCAKPPNCTVDDQTGALDGNPSFWYRCIFRDDLYSVEYYRCDHGQFVEKFMECTDQTTFHCSMDGIFPDPYNCSQYHVCSNTTEDDLNLCDSDTKYDVAALTCIPEENVTDFTCAKPPNCTTDGQLGSLNGNPSFWYRCVSENKVLYTEYYECSDGYFIDKYMQCTDQETFHCAMDGIFPDPYDCSQYHICRNTTEDILMQCVEGQEYDVMTLNCVDTSETDVTCAKSPNCTYAGQIGALDDNPSFWYICISYNDVLFKEYHRCDHGHFDDNTLTCS